jgi:hypothetical protein
VAAPLSSRPSFEEGLYGFSGSRLQFPQLFLRSRWHRRKRFNACEAMVQTSYRKPKIQVDSNGKALDREEQDARDVTRGATIILRL